jgi:polyisoprenoid-binding protein YceI
MAIADSFSFQSPINQHVMSPVATIPDLSVEKLSIDINHSSLEFSVRHLWLARVRGRLDAFSGQLTGATDAHDFSAAHLTFEADVNALNTNQVVRDQHLKSPEWFDAGQFPTMRFVSSTIRATGTDEYNIMGHLTLKGQTKPLTLHAQFRGTAHGSQGESRAGFSFQTVLNRKDFGMVMGPQDVGGGFVSDEVELTGEISLITA